MEKSSIILVLYLFIILGSGFSRGVYDERLFLILFSSFIFLLILLFAQNRLLSSIATFKNYYFAGAMIFLSLVFMVHEDSERQLNN